jgi:hypothetical protein
MADEKTRVEHTTELLREPDLQLAEITQICDLLV